MPEAETGLSVSARSVQKLVHEQVASWRLFA